jgi:hypothetical protein
MMGPDGARQILRERFPEFAYIIDDPEQCDPEDTYVAYSILVEQILERKSETALLDRAAAFINELIASKEHILEQMAFIEMLEGLAQDAEVARALYPKLDPEGRDGLRETERKFYGRKVPEP